MFRHGKKLGAFFSANRGLAYAISAFVLWGIVPIYWKQLGQVDSMEIVAHRMLWSFVMVLGLILVMGQWRQLQALIKQPKVLLKLTIGSALVSLNWFIYIWSVTNGQIVESSMGYFINPFVNILFGLLLFGERLRRNQILAISLAVLGVVYLIVMHGEVPIIALSLALSFGCYGAVKKTITVPATHGMAIETGVFFIPTLLFLMYLNSQGETHFGTDIKLDLLLILGGLVTLTPLVLFASAAQKVSMTTLGMTQYIGPTLQLIIAVYLYNEVFGFEKKIAFGFIWAGIFVYSLDQVNFQRKRKFVASSAGALKVE